MKKRSFIYILVLTVAIVAFVFWHRAVQSPIITDAKKTVMELANVSTNNAIITQRSTTVITSNTSTSATPSPEQAEIERRFKGAGQFVERKNVPVDFHGQFIDQDSNALAGVEIQVSINHLFVPATLPMVGSKNIVIDTKSGPDGRFWINNQTGDVFDIKSIRKDGYEVEPGQRTFGAVGGSFDNPVIFKMWKTNIHEKLITGLKNFQIVPDGRPYFINFSNGTIAESGPGDLKVWIKYPLQTVQGQLYDWSCEIEVISGGLLEETNRNESMYFAPTSGYTPSYRFQQQLKGGQRDWMNMQRFYLKLNNGQDYGRMNIGLCAPYSDQIPGLVSVGYAINPSGSRVLR